MKKNSVFVYTNCEYQVEGIQTKLEETHVFDLIQPGDYVVLKPNFVQESNELRDSWVEMITNPAVITATLKIVLKQLKGQGRILLTDAPMTPAKFEKILAHMPVEQWKELCTSKNVEFSIVDLRDEEWDNAANGVILNAKKLEGDPRGKVICNLKGENSEFYNKKTGKAGYYGADYDISETNRAHNGIDNQYSVSRSVIEADVFVNIAKMKTHKKAGITCCLKNLVGINTNKNLLPHHTTGTPEEGGDQFESSGGSRKLESAVTYYAKKVVHGIPGLTPLLVPLKNFAIKVWGDNKTAIKSGGWYGNDTLWRTILDLNKVLFYAEPNGALRSDEPASRKRYIGVVDGIVAGEGLGPLAPDAVNAGVLLCGTDPAAIDSVATKIMGFDYRMIPSIKHAYKVKKYKISSVVYDEIECCINSYEVSKLTDLQEKYIQHFNAAMGWKGHIELTDA